MIDSKVLLKALQKQVILLEKDLTPTGLADARLKVEWRAAKNADRTAATFETWLGERVTQVAVAWVLGTVFVRFCEDNGLIEYPFITGPGERADLAPRPSGRVLPEAPGADRPRLDHRGLRRHVGVPGGQGPVRPAPQPDVDDPAVARRGQGAAGVLAARRGADGADACTTSPTRSGTPGSSATSTRTCRRRPARPTPCCRPRSSSRSSSSTTRWTPAIEEFGLSRPASGHEDLPHRLRVIDPACGSGHFLLGAFRRLLAAWEAQKPGADEWELIRERSGVGARRGQEPVRGSDRPVPPDAGRDARRRRRAPDRAGRLPAEHRGRRLAAARQGRTRQAGRVRLRRRDEHAHVPHRGRRGLHQVRPHPRGRHLPRGRRQPALHHGQGQGGERELPQARTTSCSGKYALSVPFAERIFQLAQSDDGSVRATRVRSRPTRS